MVAVKGEEGDKDPFALVGSKAAMCGGDCDLLYDQFELYSVERMKHQILFHQDCVYCVKQAFNKEYDEVCKVKVGELQRIQVCLFMIQYICKYLHTGTYDVGNLLFTCTICYTYICTYMLVCLYLL